MRIAIAIVSAALATTSFLNVAHAQAAAKSPAAPAAAIEDCRKAGNEVSALIDHRPASPNLPAARSVFQVGIMECMEGDEVAANTHYRQARALLNEQTTAPTPPAPAR